ncbi:fimbrial protein [Parabacteroides goldsteinii]
MILLKTTYTATVFFLYVLLLLPSCSNETEIGGHHYTGEKVALNIQMETRDATDPDLEITGVRAIVFNGDGELVYNGAPSPVTGSTPGSYVVKVNAAHGINHVYIFCNETEELAGKLAGVMARDGIENITFNAVGITGTPPMYGKVENAFVEARSDGSQATVTVDGSKLTELPVKVTRMVARLGFTAIKNVDTSTQEDFKVTKIGIRVCRMPKSTTVGENQPYTADEWSDELLIGQTGELDNNGTYSIDKSTTPWIYTVPVGIHSITLPETYIPEHILSNRADASRATYLKIEAECQLQNGSTQVLRGIYLLNIGEGVSPDYNLKRNNSYHIYATITGLGALGIYAEIVEMEEHDITINWKPIDGLVIVSDKSADFDFDNDTSKNVNVWDDYSVYSGILKTYHSETGYKDVVFKYGSLIAVQTERKSTTGTAFEPPASGSDLKDILWYPGSYTTVANISDWAGIPYLQSGDIPADNSEDEVKKALGDPCKLVGLSEVQIRDNKIVDNLQWHMATAEQYQILINTCDNEANADGYPSFHWLLQPHATYRGTNGEVAGDLASGHYWTTSYGKAFNFSGGTPTAAIEDADTQNGYTIRCVRNTIPASSMKVVRIISVEYKGGTPSFEIESNVPYWTATLITGEGAGTAIDFDQFSFKKDEGQVHTTHGSYSQQVFAYLPRWENQSGRNFKVKVEGTGLDGETVNTITTISQGGYTYKGKLAFDKAIDPVPQAGGDYTVTVTLTPEDIDPPAGKLWLYVSYLGVLQTQSEEVAISSGEHNYSVPLTINPNNFPDMIGIKVILILKREGMGDVQLAIRDLQQKGTN